MKSFFVSSTFKDMQAERDILHQEVFPSLRKRLREYGEDVQELDLRWGVDTSGMSEEESGMHVIASCMDAIDRCRPYMVVLIGERYGWIPDRALVERLGDERLKEFLEDTSSITQFEILYGVMKDEDFKHCIFCFRDRSFLETVPNACRSIYEAESEQHQKKLDALKEKIRSDSRAEMMEYRPSWDDQLGQPSDMDFFAEEVEKRLWSMLEEEMGRRREQTNEERILQDARLAMAMHLQTYVKRDREQQLGSYIMLGRVGCVITGESGSGKSAYLASVAASAERAGAHVFLYYCENENCGKAEVLLRTLHCWLKKEFPSKGVTDCGSVQELLQEIRMLLGQTRERDRLILIDGVDRMEEDITELLCFLANAVIRDPVERYVFGMAVSASEAYYQKRKDRFADLFMEQRLEPFGRSQINTFVQKHAKNRGKRIDAAVVSKIRMCRNSKNPYHLSLLLQKLFMMSREDFEAAERLAPGMEGLSAFMQNEMELMPQDTKELSLAMLEEAEQKVVAVKAKTSGSSIAGDIREVLQLLAMSKHGWKLREMEEIFRREARTLPPVVMERFLQYLYDSFGEDREGRWGFRQRLLKESVLEQMTAEEMRLCAGKLCRFCRQEGGREQEACYYAFLSEGMQLLNACMEDALRLLQPQKGETGSICLTLLRERIENHGVASLEQMTQADQNALASLLAFGCFAQQDRILEDQGQWQDIFAWMRGLRAESYQAEFLCRLSGLLLERYTLNRRENYPKLWRRMAESFDRIVFPTEEEITLFLENVMDTMKFDSTRELWAEGAERLRRLRDGAKDRLHTGLMEKIDMVIGAADLWTFRKEQSSKEECLAALQGVEEYLQTQEWRGEDSAAAMLRGQKLLLIKAYLDEKQMRKVVTLTEEMIRWYEKRICPSFADRLQYADALGYRSEAVKSSYAVEYLRKEKAIREELYAYCRLETVADSLAYASYSLARLLEKEKEDREIKIEAADCDARAIALYDALLKAKKTDDSSYRYVLDWSLAARFMSVCRRADGDIWNWSQECKAQLWKEPADCARKMDEDLERLETGYRELYGEDEDSQKKQLRWVYEKGASYYDRRQEKEKALLWSRKLVRCQDELLEKNSNPMCWTGTKQLSAAAGIFLRWGENESAAKANAKAETLLKKIDPQWIEKHRLSADIDRQRRRMLLTDAEVALGRQEKAETDKTVRWCEEIIEQTKNLAEKTAEDVKLLEDAQILEGRALHVLGRDQEAVVLLQMSGMHQEKDILRWRAFQREAEVQRYFELLKAQELLGRITNDFTLLEKVCKRYSWILEEVTPEQNALYRPLLLTQTRKLEAFYHKHGKKIPVSAESILLATPQARKEKQMQELKEELYLCKKEVSDSAKGEAFSQRQFVEAANRCIDILFQIWKLADRTQDGEDGQGRWLQERAVFAKDCAKILWERGANDSALQMSRMAVNLMKTLNEKETEGISLSAQWEFYVLLHRTRDELPDFGEYGETDWALIMNTCAALCFLGWEKEKKILWLERLWEETEKYRTYLSKCALENPKRSVWLAETSWKTYDYDQEAYLLAGIDGAAEEVWVLPYLQSVRTQFDRKGAIVGSYFSRKLEELYQALDMTSNYGRSVQELIDLFAESQGEESYDYYYDIAKCVREMEGDMDSEKIQKAVDFSKKL